MPLLSSISAIFLGNFSNRIVHLVSLSILARLISPEIFGVYSAYLFVILISRTFFDHFLNKNIIIFEDNQDIHSTAIVISLAHGIIIFFFVLLGSELIAELAGLSRLSYVLQIGSFYIITRSLVNPMASIFQKKGMFVEIAKGEVYATLIGPFFTSITLAFLKFQIEALLLGLILGDLFLILYYSFRLNFSFLSVQATTIKLLYRNFWNIAIAQILNQFAQRGPFLIVSRCLGALSLGYFSKSIAIMNLPLSLSIDVLSRVGFPLIRNAVEKNRDVKEIILRLLYLILVAFFPVAAILHNNASKIIWLILGSEWLDASNILAILSISLLFRVLMKVSVVVLNSYERFDLVRGLQLIYASLVLGFSWAFHDNLHSLSLGYTYAVILSGLVMFLCVVNATKLSLTRLFEGLFRVYIVFITIQISGSYSVYLSLAISISFFFILHTFEKARVYFLGDLGLWWLNLLKRQIKTRWS